MRAPSTVAAVVRRFGRADAPLDRLSRGVVALLLESFDDLAGLALGVDAWGPLDPDDLGRLVGRLREDPIQLSRLSTRCAEHGRGRMLVALSTDPDRLDDALAQSVRLFGLLAPDGERDPAGRAAYLRVVTHLMRLTALQLLLGERPDLVPAAVASSWPTDPADGRRLPVGGLDRERIVWVVRCLDEHALLTVTG